ERPRLLIFAEGIIDEPDRGHGEQRDHGHDEIEEDDELAACLARTARRQRHLLRPQGFLRRLRYDPGLAIGAIGGPAELTLARLIEIGQKYSSNSDCLAAITQTLERHCGKRTRANAPECPFRGGKCQS